MTDLDRDEFDAFSAELSLQRDARQHLQHTQQMLLAAALSALTIVVVAATLMTTFL